MQGLIPTYTKVRLKDKPSITGTIKGICITGRKMDEIEYRVVFWMGTERKDIWVDEQEIEEIPIPNKVGFMKNNDNQQKLLP